MTNSKKNRGGYSRLLELSCAKCGKIICYYQKDGSGILKRMYLDRISNSFQYGNLEKSSLKSISNLVCPNCKETIGIPYVYEKENRLAFRLFAGSISKKIVKSN